MRTTIIGLALGARLLLGCATEPDLYLSPNDLVRNSDQILVLKVSPVTYVSNYTGHVVGAAGHQ